MNFAIQFLLEKNGSTDESTLKIALLLSTLINGYQQYLNKSRECCVPLSLSKLDKKPINIFFHCS